MDPSGGSSTPAFPLFLSRSMDTSGRSSTPALNPSGGSSTPAFPTQLSSYKLLGQIGAGISGGVVYMATCLPLGSSIVAIKSIDLNRTPRIGAKFTSLISHPNILTAHCFFTEGTHIWVVMPFMSGGSLQSIITSSFPSGLTEAVLAAVLKQTLEGLHYLHSQGIHHGDIKADNIFIDSNGSVKLTDFGNPSRSFSSSSDFPYRCAPEVIQSHSSDIWSFGVTAMELAYGRPPLWHLLPPKSRMTSRNFSRVFKIFVNSCLAEDPSERWTANDLLKHPFLINCNLVSHVLNEPPSVEERLKEWKECNRTTRLIFNEEVFAFVPVTPTETGREGPIDDAEQNLISVLNTLKIKNATMKMENETLKKEKESLMALAAQLERDERSG